MKTAEILRTTYDRIDWLRIHPRGGGRPLGSREFSAACGMSEGWLASLRTRTNQRDADVADIPVSLETARGVAAATGASEEWILTGGGDPYERYPERVEALAKYRDLPAAVRTAVESMRFHSATRPSVERWRLHIEAELAAYHRGEQLGEPLAARDKPPEGDDE